MHFYKFHIGDYLSATSFLTNDEDLAYRRLLDLYYDTESPIPNDIPWVSRRLRLDNHTVENVLKDFFTLCEDGYRNARADAEIQEYKAYISRQATNGKLGGRPKKSQRKPTANPVESQTKAKKSLTTNHKPETINQLSDDRFDVFWKQYPRKVAKPNALKAWAKLKVDDIVLKKMLVAISEQGLASRDQQYIPHPASWLNGKRWEDEIVNSPSSPKDWWVGDRRLK
jgi:uncharacterized protein YdaU (DUF1376 family)